MIEITLLDVNYIVADGNTPDGRAIKLLRLRDPQSGIVVTTPLPEEAARQISSALVAPAGMVIPSPDQIIGFKRNGGESQ